MRREGVRPGLVAGCLRNQLNSAGIHYQRIVITRRRTWASHVGSDEIALPFALVVSLR